MPRPDFSEIKSFEEFSKYYWYREELIKICRMLGLKSKGGKIELNKVIESYFKGDKLLPEKSASSRHSESNLRQSETKTRHSELVSGSLSLSTSLIECNFTFGPRFRQFFEKETGVKPFKFNVDMVASAKKAKGTNDINFTLGDLLDIYYDEKTYAKYDKSALQWNKFVQDFCADPATARFPNKLKTAARLWKIVRESTWKKVYKHELLEILNEKENANAI